MKRLRPIAHEDRLSIVEHLDELRSRLLVCGAVLLIAFIACYWQNQALIRALNRALPATPASLGGLASEPNQSAKLREGILGIELGARQLAAAPRLSHGARQAALRISSSAAEAASALPKAVPHQVRPITIGVGESFTTTLMVVGYFAIVFSLPFLLYQLYAFVVPALQPNERRVVTPLMIIAPLLFVVGALFAYFLVLPPAVHFLQGYNSENFDILVQAKTYYRFEMLVMIGIGLAFEVPLFLLALQRAGVISARTLTLNWRYAVVLIAVIAAALPGVDPVSMGLEMLPLFLLYLASIVLLKIFDRRDARRAAVQFKPVGQSVDIGQ